jgi:hypothetical protein
VGQLENSESSSTAAISTRVTSTEDIHVPRQIGRPGERELESQVITCKVELVGNLLDIALGIDVAMLGFHIFRLCVMFVIILLRFDCT